MTERDDGGQAFPNGDAVPGMTLRDYFAGQAMIAVALRWQGTVGDIDEAAREVLAYQSYAIADEMLERRSRPIPERLR